MKLTIRQRLAVTGIYIVLILLVGYLLRGSLSFIANTSDTLNSVLLVTALGLVLGTYISEPFFSKPVDVIIRWIAIFLFVLGLNNRQNLILYEVWLILSAVFIGIALLLIFLHNHTRYEKMQRTIIDLICKFSRPDFVFTVLYLDIVITFFDPSTREYPLLIGFAFLLAINKPVVWFVKWISKLLHYNFKRTVLGDYLGQIIGHENTALYKVSLENDNVAVGRQDLRGNLVFLEDNTNAIVGIILEEKVLLGKKWLRILSLRDPNNNLISFSVKSLKPLLSERSVFSTTNAVFLLDINEVEYEVKQSIETNFLYINFNLIIGTVCQGSTINNIKFDKLFSDQLLMDKEVGEGSIVQTTIGGRQVLYQIIDAMTKKEELEANDTHGFTVGTAQKLGRYNLESNELNAVKWLPEMHTPVFFMEAKDTEYNPKHFIGKLPKTNYGIAIKNIHELVTHNTAILGILGIGKSCLTFELIQKLVSETDVKIFCIDLTNQYSRELHKYINTDLIEDEIPQAARDHLKASNVNGTESNPASWGNESLYSTTLTTEFEKFIAGPKRVITINPDWHQVSKAGAAFKIQHKVDLTAAEKTRIISERIFVIAKKQGETDVSRYLIIFEEAHSLVPEWNSIASEGDKSATNGTAKVVLQGRKYGLGSMVITQRTANISKSILNQCNTIFALRVFDDTGKQFLENYIGSEYSNLLPTLEERHCIAIGKAMRLKQPVIIELNDMNEIKLAQTD